MGDSELTAARCRSGPSRPRPGRGSFFFFLSKRRKIALTNGRSGRRFKASGDGSACRMFRGDGTRGVALERTRRGPHERCQCGTGGLTSAAGRLRGPKSAARVSASFDVNVLSSLALRWLLPGSRESGRDESAEVKI